MGLIVWLSLSLRAFAPFHLFTFKTHQNEKNIFNWLYEFLISNIILTGIL